MAKSIRNKSIFGGYKKSEDIVTAALLHLLQLGGPSMMNYLFGDLGVESSIQINTQVKGKKSRPDGELFAGYHIYIESKIAPWNINIEHNQEQLMHHSQLLNEEGVQLLYITCEEEMPVDIAKYPQIAWTCWSDILSNLKTYQSEFNNEVIVYLVNQFEVLLDDLVFSKYDGIKDEDRVLIVPGRWADSIAKHHGFYKYASSG